MSSVSPHKAEPQRLPVKADPTENERPAARAFLVRWAVLDAKWAPQGLAGYGMSTSFTRETVVRAATYEGS